MRFAVTRGAATWCALMLCMTLCGTARAEDATHFSLPNTDVGTRLELTGKWSFAREVGRSGTILYDASQPLPVPSFLNRIQWWLDDSDDFNKFEADRVKALGIDVDHTDSGLYSTSIEMPQLPKDRHVWIEFDGVAMSCKVSCNGTPLGEHKGMFSRFSFDLTPALKPGSNQITVYASMEKVSASTVPLGQAVTVNLSAAKVVSMSKGMFGPLSPNQDNRAYDLLGIWQPVRLVVRGGAHIDDVFFQPDDDLKGAKVSVEAKSDNAHGNVKVRAHWTDLKDPTKMFEITQTADLAGIAHVDLQANGMNPELWTPADPNLYRLDVTLESADGQVLDKWSHNVGFRTFKVQGNQLFLNGHPYWLRGANQLPYGKNPFDPDLPRKLIQLMHDNNLRVTRTHATPWNEAWLDAADEIGLGVSIEGIRPWALAGETKKGDSPLLPPDDIYQHWLMENQDVIKRARNHPSVLMWTVGNEMNLKDGKQLDKWKLLSGVVKQTRAVDPTRPVVATSSYYRESDLYDNVLKPAGVDDGDIDDLHSYNGWYGPSNFILESKFEKEMKSNQHKRPLIGQEFATGYPNLDDGLPALRYTRDLMTPQAWVGVYAYPGHDASIWLDSERAVTKRWAEQLRFQRADISAGFLFFSAETWIHHSYDSQSLQPYPVVEAMKYALAPVGLAMETTQRRFWGGDAIATNLFVTNDDEKFRDLKNLSAVAQLFTPGSNDPIATADLGKIDAIPYYAMAKLPIKIAMPKVDARQKATLMIRLMDETGSEVSRTLDDVELFPKPARSLEKAKDVITIAAGQPLDGLAPGKDVYQKISDGATAIVFSPGKDFTKLFKDDVTEPHPPATKPADAPAEKSESLGEFADWTPAVGTKLVENLEPMDIKWWAHTGDWRAYVSDTNHRLKAGGKARELLRYIPPHSYMPAEKVPEQIRSVLFEIPIGKGRLWVCDLALDSAIGVDPAARLFAENLYRAAADPDSTKNLKPMPTHEELLKFNPDVKP